MHRRHDDDHRCYYGVVTGLLTGFILSWLQFKYIWVNQRRIDEKLTILSEAARALALFGREALDPNIQKERRINDSGNGGPSTSGAIELNTETDVLKTSVLVKTEALFSDKAYRCLDEAFRANLDVNDPSGEEHRSFIQRSAEAIKEMGKDINAEPPNWIIKLKSQYEKK